MNLLAQMAVQGAVGFAIGAGTNELAIRWVFNALFTKKKRIIAENTKNLIYTELMTSEKIAAKVTSPEVRAVLERDVRRQLDDWERRATAIASNFGKGLGQVLPGLVKDEVRAFAKRVCQTGIEKIYTGHCTGERAYEILHEELGDCVQQLKTGLEIVI